MVWGSTDSARVSRSGNASASQGYANTGVHIGDVNLHTGAPVRTRYSQQIRRLAPAHLVGREAELAELAAFCSSPETAGRYRWWRAPAWSGKSALMSWFVLNPPPGVRIVSFFITARLAGQSDRVAYVENVLEQLVTLLGQQMPGYLTESNREAHLLGLLEEAAEACAARGETLVLVIDGLDEDRSVTVGPQAHSIAATLPVSLPAGMRVVVAGRPDPPIPSDVPRHHPLRFPATTRRLAVSSAARAFRDDMKAELKQLLHGPETGRDLLGLLTAAGGGLTAQDIAELTGLAAWEVDDHFVTVTGRSFTRRDSHYRPGESVDVFLLAHEELQVTATEMLERHLGGYLERLHAWADGYRDRAWPEDTPEYLLRGYHRMLVANDDLDRVVELTTDKARQNRMLDLSGGDTAALAEISTAQAVLLGRAPVDLLALARLAVHRDCLTRRNSNIPVGLPAVWGLVGKPNRGVALAHSFTYLSEQCEAVALLAMAVAETGDPDRANELLDEAIATVGAMPEPYHASRALTQVACAAVHLGRFAEVPQLASLTLLGGARGALVQKVIETAAVAGVRGEDAQLLDFVAVTFAAWEDVGDLEEKVDLISSAVAQHPSLFGRDYVSGMLAAVEEQVRDVENADNRAYLLARVARGLIACGDREHAAELLGEAERHAIRVGPGLSWHRVPTYVAEGMIELGDRPGVRRILDLAAVSTMRPHAHAFTSVVDVAGRAGFFDLLDDLVASYPTLFRASQVARLRIEQLLAHSTDFARAEQLAEAIADLDERDAAWRAIADAAAGHGRFDRAAAAMQSLGSAARRSEGFTWLAGIAAKAGNNPRAVELLRLAEVTARGSADVDRQVEVRASLARAAALCGAHLVANELFDHADKLLQVVERTQRRLMALPAFATAAGVVGRYDRVLARIDRDSDRSSRFRTLIAAVQGLRRTSAANGIEVLLRRAVEEARSDPQPETAATHLAELAEVAVEVGDRALALELVAQADRQPIRYRYSLKDVARAMAAVGNIERALALIDDIGESPERTHALAWITPLLARQADHDLVAKIVERTLETDELPAFESACLVEAKFVMGDAAGAAELLDRAEDAARQNLSTYSRSNELNALVRVAVDTGDLVKAEAIARSVDDPGGRASALLLVARAVEPVQARSLLGEAVVLSDDWLDCLDELARVSPEVVLSLIDEVELLS